MILILRDFYSNVQEYFRHIQMKDGQASEIGKKGEEIVWDYTEKLIAEGWKEDIGEGGVFSPDLLAIFYYGRAPYVGKLMRYHYEADETADAELEKKFEELA